MLFACVLQSYSYWCVSMTTVEMIKRRALTEAAEATNVAEVLIRNGLVSRKQVRDLCNVYGVPYQRGDDLPEDVLIHLAIDAGVGLRNVRLSMTDDHVPLVTTTPGHTHPLSAFTDGFWGKLEVRHVNGGTSTYPVSESHHDALSATLMTEGFAIGLSIHYPGFLAFLTADARIVFVNRKAISRADFSPSSSYPSYLGEQHLDLLSTLGWIADGWHLLAKGVAEPLLAQLISQTGALFDETGTLHVDEAERAKFPEEMVKVRRIEGSPELIEIAEFDLTDFDQSMSNGGDFVIFSRPDGAQSGLAKSTVEAIELPLIYFSDYASALESSHYLAMPRHLKSTP